MNFIKTIKDSEKAAHDMHVHAEEESKTLVEGARNAQTQALDKHAETLQEKRTARLTAQREDLKATYKEILSRGTAEAERVAQSAQNKTKDAVRFVLEQL